MTVMSGLQDTYPLAAIFRAILRGAMRRLQPDYAGLGTAEPVVVPRSGTRAGRSLPVGPKLPHGVVDALMNEASLLDFWETFSRV